MRILIDEFSDDPIIKAYNGDAVSLTFRMEIDGREVYVLVEDIPQNHPSSACWIFDDKKNLDEILETLKSNGWNIVINEND